MLRELRLIATLNFCSKSSLQATNLIQNDMQEEFDYTETASIDRETLHNSLITQLMLIMGEANFNDL